MNEIKEIIDQKKADDTTGEQELNKIDVLGIEFQTNEKGIELLKGISKAFEMIEVNKSEKIPESTDSSNKHERLGDFIERITADNSENHLTFIDGVLVTWKIFNKILDKRLRDDNGDPEGIMYKGKKYDYLGIINDDVTDLLLNQVLENGYFKTRGHQLMYEFGIDPSV